jgi:hypothetical protein
MRASERKFEGAIEASLFEQRRLALCREVKDVNRRARRFSIDGATVSATAAQVGGVSSHGM